MAASVNPLTVYPVDVVFGFCAVICSGVWFLTCMVIGLISLLSDLPAVFASVVLLIILGVTNMCSVRLGSYV